MGMHLGKYGSDNMFENMSEKEAKKQILDIDVNQTIRNFREKDVSDGSRINAGFMVLEPEIFDYLENDDTVFEKEPIAELIQKNELKAYIYNGFWQCMDTKRELEKLQDMWQNGKAPWKVWE